MQIQVTFDSLEEVRDFTEQVMIGLASKDETTTAPVTQDVLPTITQPVMQVPVQQSVPTQQAPVATQLPPVQQPVVQTPVQQASVQQPQPVPTTVQNYTLDDLSRAAMTLMDSGRQMDLQGLLKQFGVEVLPALPKEQYGAFATALRGMGAQI